MSFISYAQNFEDVMLWRALKHVERGFYIDVGANDPRADSVTFAFYASGWHGINIEPLPSHHADLTKERPRDVNLQCAAGAVNGEIEVWECDVRGWGTASLEVVAAHTANGHAGKFHKVPVELLTNICAHHVSGPIHFLKIDVEGFEKSVIDGMDFSRFRPWILVVEATRPNSIEEIHDVWEGDVLSAGYVLAYSDGVNRFYVAKEHSELLNSLRYPPNVFDQFIRVEQLDSELRAQQASERAANAEAQAANAEAQAQQATLALTAVHTSLSWRLTAPLRAASRLIGVLLQKLKAIKQAINAKKGLWLKSASLYVNCRPKLRRAALIVLARFPTLKARVRATVMNKHFGPTVSTVVPTKLAELTPHARQIYANLKAAIELHQKERR